MSLRDKKILITAGPTLVPIDSVRVISNTATGGTGILLARKLQSLGAKVTLLLGGAEPCCLDKKIRLIRFRFFDELKRAMLKELKKKYNIVIHSAAVSDYRPLKSYGHKVGSGRKAWRLDLVPTPKIINLIKRTDRSLFLVGFKFEPETRRKILIDKAKSLIRRADLDLAVANTVDRNRYQAYILNKDKIQDHARSKKHLAEKLAESLSKSFNY
ncbi:MAG: phosphopantothenoylcysteine decarboxylase [Candidatus Omnitrophica bacterium]|nr:phosphopantothenoylcysteine decarboxylase [Candidatus Omnitrophota bacterium]MDD5553873.1 phosphopantothenoylcysteine decarboxylase [Candidatus Omnitrophota bacterium]